MPATSRGPLGSDRPLSLAALDAAISETIGKPVRADRLARDDAVYRAIVRRVIAEGSLRYRTTYAELARAAGYPVPRLTCRENRKQARIQRVSTVYRALCSLRACGLVQFKGVKRENGQWRCLGVRLTPAAFGPEPPFGRSRRRPRRLASGRISFIRRSGTSPPVATAKEPPESEDVRGRAREGPPTAASGEGGAFLAAALAPTKANSAAPADRPWPHERFDLPDPELVEVVELFEESFGIPAQFSYRKHGPALRRALDRFDRYTLGERRAGWNAAKALLRQRGALYRTGNRNLARVRSLAYFIPKLDQDSKRRRREWKRKYTPIST